MKRNYYFKNAMLLTLDEKERVIKNGYLLTSDTKIAYVGEAPLVRLPKNTEVISGEGLLLCPGLVNAHTHTPMTLLRGFAEDIPLNDWLLRIWPAEAALSERDHYYGSLLGIAEMLAYGTTSISDMYRSSHVIARAAADSGVKANICESITCSAEQTPQTQPSILSSLETIKEFQNYDHGRIRCDTSIQSVFQTTPKLWEYIARLAKDWDLGIHTHICETQKEVNDCLRQYQKTPVQALEDAGVFASRVIACHGIYLSPKDIDILFRSHAYVVHDPCSNLKCCCGLVNLKPILEARIPVALGTDGVCSNNSGDLFETMKFTALNQKQLNNDCTFLPSSEILKMCIQNGLASQGRQKEAGALREGMDADIIALDFSHPGLLPCFSPGANLVYSAHGSHVTLAMVRGQILYNKGEYSTIDIEHIRYEVRKITERLA